jgi:serine/threonine-protein kinase
MNVVHGDLKPEHVMIANGRAYVADVGVLDAVERSLADAPRGAASAALRTGQYVAPECRDPGAPAAHAGPRADMYAVGVLAHEMLTGRTPAPESESLEDVRSLPPWLETLVRRALSPEPGARWSDAAQALATVPRPSGGARPETRL